MGDWEAIQRPGGAVSRGPRRWYVEVHPEAISGFVELITHPWIAAMSEAVLGPDYEIVELGFDTPFEGARTQPWHRDFPAPEETWRDRRNEDQIRVTVSAGCAEIDGERRIAEGLSVADVWLSQARRSGRDQVIGL